MNELVVIGFSHTQGFGIQPSTVVFPTLRASGGGAAVLIAWTKSRRAMSDEDYETWVRGGVSPTLNAFDNATETRATVIVTSTVALYEPMSVFEENWSEASVKNALRANASKSSHVVVSPQFTEITQQVGEVHMAKQEVRRLTPIECERLQGFPDNWTEGQADSHRYKQMGNAVTVNVAHYLGELINEARS